MSSSDIKITITATNNASKAFDDVTKSAEKIKPALDTAASSADKIKPAADSATAALGPLPGKIDDLTTSATNAKVPLSDAGTNTTALGDAVVNAGRNIKGPAGDIVESLGNIVNASKDTDTSSRNAAIAMYAISGAAIGVAAVLGPAVIGAALDVAVSGVKKLADLLGGGDSLADHLDETRASASKLNSEILQTAAGMENAADALVLFKGGSAIGDMVEDFARLIELQKVFTGGNPAGDFANGAVPGIENYNQAMGEAITLTGKYGISTSDLTTGNTDLTGQLEELTQVQALYNDLIKVTGPGQEAVRSRLTELVGEYQNGTITLDELNAQLVWMNTNLQTAYVAPAIAAAALAKFSKAAFDASVNVGLLNTDVEKLFAGGIKTPSIGVAFNIDRSSLESTFNIIVGGTNKLAESAQAVADWSAGLADASKGVSILGKLLEDKKVSADQYNNALAANNRIQSANISIQEDLLSIQAKQAPLLADLTDQQAEYIAGLAALPAAQQVAALGFLDSAESAKAMELAYLAADAASGQLGDTGEATATKIITAAANADPVMKSMLTDMGLISQGANGEVVVNFPNATDLTTAVDSLSASIDALTIAIGGTPPIETSSNAAATQVDVDNLTGAIIDIPDSSETSINATDNASGVIGGVSQALDAINGKTANTYLNNYVTTVVSQVSPPSSGGSSAPIGGRLGGVMGYANGGMVTIEAAEVGGELARFANGGTAYLPTHGLYSVPVGTNILPAPATKAEMSRRGGGGDIYINTIQIIAQNGDLEGMLRSEALRLARQR